MLTPHADDAAHRATVYIGRPHCPSVQSSHDAPPRRRLVSRWRRVIDTDFDRYHMMRETGAGAGGQRRRRTASALVSPPPFTHPAIRETVELCTISLHLELIARRLPTSEHSIWHFANNRRIFTVRRMCWRAGNSTVQGTAERRAPRLGPNHWVNAVGKTRQTNRGSKHNQEQISPILGPALLPNKL